MADRKLRVEILGDASDLKRAAGDADGALNKMGGSFSKVAGGAALLGGGLATAGFAAFKFAEAAAEDERAAGALAKTLENSAGATREQIAATEEWISAQGRSLGVADDELRPALDRLVRATGDVGQAQKLASLAMDISTGTGKDLVSVSEALAKAQNGNLGALKKLDPALADLIKNTGSSELALESLAQTFDGQASAAADTAAGKLKIAKLQFAEMQEEIGAKLIPVLAKLAGFVVDDVIPAIQSIVGALERFGGWVRSNWDVISAALIGLGVGLATVLVPAFVAWATAAGAAAIATLAAAAPVIAIGAAIAALAAGLVWAYQNCETFRDIVNAAFEGVKAAVGLAIDYIGLQIDIVVGAFKLAWGAAQEMKDKAVAAWDALSGGVQTAKDTVSGLVDDVVTFFKELPGKIVNALSSLGQTLKDVVGGAIDGAKARVSEGIDGIIQFFKDLPGRITEQMAAIGGAALSVGKEVIKKLGEGLSNVVEFAGDIGAAVAKAVKDAINFLIDKVNNALEFTINGPFGTSFTVNPTDIPRLHTGGIFDSGRGEGLALLKDGEGVFTREQMRALPRLFNQPSGGTVVNITVQADATTDTVALGRTLLETIESSMRAGVRPTMLQAA